MIIHVKLTMASGATVRFRTKRLTTRENVFGQTAKLEWEKTRLGSNLFDVTLEHISAITTRRWFW